MTKTPHRNLSEVVLPAIVASVLGTLPIQSTQANPTLLPDSHAPMFAEPVSGRPVSEYRVTLPLKREESREFAIPDDCDLVRRHAQQDTADRSRIVAHRLWTKTDSDCRYHELLHRHDPSGLIDFISGIDFRALDLRSLPLDTYCDQRPGSLCVSRSYATIDARPLFPSRANVPPDKKEKYSSTPCHLIDGRYRGRICREDDTLLCVPDRSSTFRLLGVDYGDVDGDGILDAVLRLNLLLPRTGRRSVRLPLTRLHEDAPLTLTPPLGDRR
jgi:hypothetical protein